MSVRIRSPIFSGKGHTITLQGCKLVMNKPNLCDGTPIENTTEWAMLPPIKLKDFTLVQGQKSFSVQEDGIN